MNSGMYTMRHLVGQRTICILGSITTGLCFLGMAIAGSVAPGSIASGKAVVALVAIWQFFYNGE